MAEVLKLGQGISVFRRANKAQLATFFDVSVNTINAWVRRGCPVLKRGGPGEAWEFDALEVAEWRFSGSTAEEDDEDLIRPEMLPPKDRKDWFESEIKRRDLQKMDRELIPAGEVETVVATAFSAIAQDMRSLPDYLERRHGIEGELAESIEDQINSNLDGLAAKLSDLSIDEVDE